MSFQDFASPSSRPSRPTGANAAGRSPTRNTKTTMGQDSLRPISESLLQYQRNVGILEKIVQSMTTQKNSEEAALQYSAQVDVISQLAAKVDRQLSTQKKAEKNPTVKTSLIKLERDFNLVKDRVSALQESATKLRRQSAALQQQERQAAGVLADSNKTEESMGYEEFQRHMELQLQQDRTNEQIMREREEEIRNINKGMHQVNEIYKDLAHIVGSQQEHVDSIETQMEESRVNADAGLQQVEKANQQFGSAQCVIS